MRLAGLPSIRTNVPLSNPRIFTRERSIGPSPAGPYEYTFRPGMRSSASNAVCAPLSFSCCAVITVVVAGVSRSLVSTRCAVTTTSSSVYSCIFSLSCPPPADTTPFMPERIAVTTSVCKRLFFIKSFLFLKNNGSLIFTCPSLHDRYFFVCRSPHGQRRRVSSRIRRCPSPHRAFGRSIRRRIRRAYRRSGSASCRPK